MNSFTFRPFIDRVGGRTNKPGIIGSHFRMWMLIPAPCLVFVWFFIASVIERGWCSRSGYPSLASALRIIIIAANCVLIPQGCNKIRSDKRGIPIKFYLFNSRIYCVLMTHTHRICFLLTVCYHRPLACARLCDEESLKMLVQLNLELRFA